MSTSQCPKTFNFFPRNALLITQSNSNCLSPSQLNPPFLHYSNQTKSYFPSSIPSLSLPFMSTAALPPSAPTATAGGGLGYGIAIAVSILVLISTIMLASYACVRIKANVIIITRHRHNHSINNNNNNNNNSSFRDASDGPGVVVLGMEKPAIETCYGPKIVIGESKRLSRPSDQGPCAICLSEYLPKETIRCVPECRHCFHAECIDEWLKMSATCPLCRNSPVPSPLPTPAATPLSELVPLAFDAR